MYDQIHISGLHLRTIIGVNRDERRDRQDVIVDIVLHTDARIAAVSDEIEDAVNYRTITKRVIDLVENSKYHLVEKLAEEIAKLCLQDTRVESVRVGIEKPTALRFASSVGVTIERKRDKV